MLKENDAKLAEQFKLYAKDLTVIVAEDDEKLRDRVCSLLSKVFTTIHKASDGSEALELYNKIGCDLLLTDINMPNMNGIELISEIRNTNDDLAIVVTSAYNESEYYSKLIELGVDGFILKPLEIVQFMYTIARICKNIQNAKEKELLKKEILSEQNRNIAYAKAISSGRELSKHELTLLRKSYKPISAQEFSSAYLSKLDIYAEELELLDEQADLYINRFVGQNDVDAKNWLVRIFDKYSKIVASLKEFDNLSVALEKFALTIEAIEKIENQESIKDLLFGVTDNLRRWRKSIFTNKDVDNIHYLDASLINDCIQIEVLLSGVDVKLEGELEFF